jgi:aminoglycoside phosphotransferase (APT) family kinase protein
MPESVTTKRRDVDDVRVKLEPWLAARLDVPKIDGLHVTAPEGHGFSNDTFMVDAIVGDSPLSLVVQAAPMGPALFPEYPIGRMATIQSDLRSHSDVPIASIRWLEEDLGVLGGAFYVMDKVEGRIPDEAPLPYHAAGWVFEASARERQHLWMSILEAMGKLHRLDVAAHFPYLTKSRWGMALDADPAAERVQQWSDYTIWASEGEPPASLMEAWDRLAETLPPRPERLSIGWGDAKLGNLMFQGFDVVALFDWELCGVGPAEEDLMNQLAVDLVLADVAQVPRLDGFLSPEDTVSAYEEILERNMVGTAWWYTFALAKMAAEIHRILRQSVKMGAMPGGLDLEEINSAMPRLREALQSQ